MAARAIGEAYPDFDQWTHPNKAALDRQIAECKRTGLVRVVESALEPVTFFRGYVGMTPVRCTLLDDGRWRIQYGDPGPLRKWWLALRGRPWGGE